MKKKTLSIFIALVLALSLCLVTAVPVAAATGGTVTFEFHASDLLNITPGEVGTESTDAVHSEQVNARQLRDRTPALDWQYNTFSDQDSYNAYLNWRDGIGSGEGISAFNIWLVDQPIAKAWGETIVKKPGAPVIATCPEGWNIQLVENPYNVNGFILEWYTTDSTKYLRPGEDQGVFSFTVDVYRDEGTANWDAGDPAVQVGDTCRIWFGSAVYEDENGVHLDPPFHSGFIFDDASWGTLLPATVANSPGVFPSSDYKVGGADVGELLQFDATLDLEAKAATVNVPADYDTIQEAIVAVAAGGTVNVAAGSYTESININKSLTLQGAGDTSTTISGTAATVVTISADGVVIDGFTMTNPSGKHGISALDHSNIAITGNIVTDVGSSDASSSGTNWGIKIQSLNAAVDAITITGNQISYIAGGNNKTAQGIVIGDSNGDLNITNLLIQDNMISNITSATVSWDEKGRGAYGILLSHGTGTTGKTVDAQVLDNTISYLEGLWAHGIGLEGNTPGAVVERNDISHLIDHKSYLEDIPDAVAVQVEDNASADTVGIHFNNFSDVLLGVWNKTETNPEVDATNNWWGNASGPRGQGLGLGNAVSTKVDFEPWLLVPVVKEQPLPDTYGKTLALKDGWTLISTDKAVAEPIWVGTNPLAEGLGKIMAYEYIPGSGFPEAAATDLGPLTAIYVKTKGGGGVGIDYAVVGPNVIYSKDLKTGWNLISVPSMIGDAGDILSPLAKVTVGTQQGVGLATLVSQDYNQFSGSFQKATLTDADWDDLAMSLCPFDGYWAYMNAAKTFEVIPQ